MMKVTRWLCTIGVLLTFPLADVYVASTITVDQPLDTYGAISWEDEKARLDNFAIALQESPKYVGYIVVFAGKRACPNEAKARALRARDYVVKVRGVEPNRVVWKDGGYREVLTTILALAPSEATELGLRSTLKPSEVKLIKDCKGGLPIHRRRRK